MPQIIEQGLVKVAAPLLLDAASSVRNASAGMLRNMSAVSMEICDSMVDQDVMTPLTCYFHEVGNRNIIMALISECLLANVAF